VNPNPPPLHAAPALLPVALPLPPPDPIPDAPLEYVPGKRGSRNVVWRGHRYTKDRQRDQKSYWRCTLRHHGCSARLTLDGDTPTNTPVHTHGEQQAEILVHKAKVSLKKKAATSDQSTKFLVASTTAGLDFETSSKMNCTPNALGKMARLARQKANRHPINPSSLEHLVIPPSYLKTHNGEDLLLWDSTYSATTRRSFLFGTEDNLRHGLSNALHWVIDGTFKVAPTMWTQLLTIHGILNTGRRIPAAYGLLPGKTQLLYTNLLQELDACGPFHPDSILLDYEKGLQNAVMAVWPSTTLRGCYFHFKKCLWRHFSQSDLLPEYQVVGSEIRKSFQMMGALPFVPIDDVDRAWRYLKPLLPGDMDAFSRYFEHTWMGTSATQPLFSQWSWNQFDACQAGVPRSSNIAEGWHNGFRSLVGCAHPTVWKFLDALKLEQSLTDFKLVQHLMREPLEPRPQKWIKFDQRLNAVIENYDDYEILDYLKVIGCLMGC